MPELPDITVYIEALEQRINGHRPNRILINSPFLIRTATPPISDTEGKQVVELRRLGKRICIGLEADLWLVLHLMIAGRLHWKDAGRASFSRSKNHLAAFEFDNGLLTLTEAGTQRRASLHVVQGQEALNALNPGGVELFGDATTRDGFINLKTFTQILTSENHTLKRSLTDPRLFS